MPFGSYAFGSMFFGGRASLQDGKGRLSKRKHFDGIECFTLFMPLAPLRPVHVWDWKMERSDWSWTRRVTRYSYRAIPIRWDRRLLYQVLLRYWLFAPCLLALFITMGPAIGWPARFLAFLVFAGTGGGLWHVWKGDVRDRRIRELLGRHRLGYSDPCYWTDELQALLAPAKHWFGTDTFAEAVKKQLAAGNDSQAMWAARLCAACEDAKRGEALTDEVLLRAATGSRGKPKKTYPLLREGEESDAARYWHRMVGGHSRAEWTQTLYAEHIAGQLAYAFQRNDPDEGGLVEETSLVRPDPERGTYRNQGLWMIFGVMAGTFALLWVADLFRHDPGAEQRAEVIQRQEEHRAKMARQEETREAKRREEARQAQRQSEARRVKNPPVMPAQSLGTPGSWVYLADLPFYEVRPGPWPITNNGTTGERFRPSAISVQGEASPKGMGMHPPDGSFASVQFALGGQAKLFDTTAALNDSATEARDSAIFEVWCDGERKWNSSPLTKAGQKEPCRLDISGVQVLELRVLAPGDYWSLHAVWFEPRVQL